MLELPPGGIRLIGYAWLNRPRGGTEIAAHLTRTGAPARRPALRWLVLLGVWTIPALLSTSQTWGRMRMQGEDASILPNLLWNLVNWYLWAAFTPLILRLKHRYLLFEEEGAAVRLRAVPLHLAAGLLLALLHGAIMSTYSRITDPGSFTSLTWGRTFLLFESSLFLFDVLAYAALLAVAYAIDFYRRYRDRELVAERLRGRLVESRLQALQMQIHPHFLFNTLHAASVLIDEAPQDAAHVLDLLGDLLRITLETEGAQEVRLEQELAFLERYLEIQHTRFQERLAVQVEVPGELLDAAVPSLSLQPIVENAVRFAVEPRTGPGTIRVRAERAGEDLVIRVRDDGPGDGSSGRRTRPGRGIGLSNLRERLAALYGARASLDLVETGEGGLEAVFRLPWRTVPNAAERAPS